MLRDVTHAFWSVTCMQAFWSTAHCLWQRAPYQVYLRCQWQRAVSLSCRPGSWHIHSQKKEKKRRRTGREAEAERNSVPKENHARKQTAATQKWPCPINRAKKGWEGQFRVLEARQALPSSSSWRESSSATVQTIRWMRHRWAFETGRSQQVHHGDIRQQFLRIDEDRQRANSQHHRRRLPCRDDDHFADVKKKKKNMPSLSQTKWRSGENVSNRLSSFLGVHQMILATFKSVNNASCRGMWEEQSKPSDLGWTGLYPDLGAARLRLDLPDPARILVLDCLCQYCSRKRVRGSRSSGRLFSGKGTPPKPRVCGRWDLMCSDQTQSISGHERVQVGRARAAKRGDHKQSDSYTHVYACAAPCISVTTQNGGRSLDLLRVSCPWSRLQTSLDAGSFFFRFQEAERRKGRPPRFALDQLCLKWAILCLFSHINLVLSGFAHHKSDLGLSTFGWKHWSVEGEVPPTVYLWGQAESRKSRHWSSEELLGLTHTRSLVD